MADNARIDDLTKKSYQLHSAANRKAVFAGLSPRLWLEAGLVRTWVVADTAAALRIFRSPHAAVSSMADVLAAIKNRYGIELSGVAYACRVLPLLVTDEIHPATRRGFATYLAARLTELEAQLPDIATLSFAPLRRKGTVDLVSEVVAPFLRRIFSVVLQCPLPEEVVALHVGDILAFNASLSTLKSLDARITKALSFLRAETPGQVDVEWKFSSLVFGLDSLAMMLTEGVVAALREQPAQSTSLRLPEFPIETGLPLTFRRVKGDFTMEGCEFKANDFIRLQLQPFGYSQNAEDRKFIFGTGMHSCVGKQLSLRIWDRFRAELERLDLKARIVSYETSPSHYIILHKRVLIEVL